MIQKGNDPELDQYLDQIYQEGMNKGLELGIKKGISRGISLEKENFDRQFTIAAGKLMKAGVDYETICDATGFSMTDLKEIEKDLP